MGEIKKILTHDVLPERELHNSRLFVDLSENVHIHFRELRLMFGAEEFFEFSEIIRDGAKDIKKYLKRNKEYKEEEVFDGIMVAGGKHRQLSPLQKSPKPHESKYYPNRLQIELQDEKVIDAIHLHFRDYRLVMNIKTFKAFTGGMNRALGELEGHLRKNPYKEGKHPFRQKVATGEWIEKKITWYKKLKYRIKRFFGKTETN